jgi:sulfate adenylyltransferase
MDSMFDFNTAPIMQEVPAGYDVDYCFEVSNLGIAPLFFKSFYYCKTCQSVVNEKICPHPPSEQIQFSGTKIRDMLVRGEIPPAELIRPEVARVIMAFKDPFVE